MPGGPSGRHLPVNRRGWRRLAWIVAGLVAVVGVMAGLAVANMDRLVRRVLVSAIEKQTGSGVRLDGVTLGLRDSSLLIQNLVLSNPPGFSPRPLLSLPELYLAYDREAAQTQALRFREVRVHLSELHLEVDHAGNTNLMALAQRAGSERGQELNASNQMAGFNFQGIDRLTLTLGRIQWTDQRDPRRNRTFELGVTNRTLMQVQSLTQLLPLAIEIALRGGMATGADLGPLVPPPPAR